MNSKNPTQSTVHSPQSTKKRLDILLVERGLAVTLKEAQSLILSGSIYSGDRKLDKAGISLPTDAPLEIRAKREHPWVSRGGIKLAHALKAFAIDVTGMTAIDVGASTGGFTDVLLTRGARKVYAVDVGYGELAWKLQQDGRVAVLDRTNARFLTHEQVPEAIDIVVCDVSFISIRQALPPALSLVKPGGWLATLIKPQFEVRRGEVGEGGIVRDPALHARVCGEIGEWVAGLGGWEVIGMTPSPITGQEGNMEFLLAAKRG